MVNLHRRCTQLFNQFNMFKSFVLGGTSKKIHLSDYPTECPECHSTTTPIYKGHHICTKDNEILFTFLICPNPTCETGYSAQYKTSNWHDNPTIYNFEELIKGQPKIVILSEVVSELSNNFQKIYDQSFHAEQIGLDEIAGVGYRKSLEFLIKDYIIYKNPKISEEVKSTYLGKCIDKWVDDPRIKKTAKRAAWLGNDETHYVKKWETKEIKDLKILIQLTVNWVESDYLTEKFVDEMPE